MQGMVERDPMTGLFSKIYANYLVNQIVSEKIQGISHALLVLDMDNFKQVNDKLGHLFGDAVILDVALTLKRIFLNTDILGHIGGDEFMVLIKISRMLTLSIQNAIHFEIYCDEVTLKTMKAFQFQRALELRFRRSMVQISRRCSLTPMLRCIKSSERIKILI